MTLTSFEHQQTWSQPNIQQYAVEKRASLFVRFCGFAVICTGLAVIYGWLTQNNLLVQIRSDYSAMKFNTALSLVVAALALLSAEQGMRRTSLLLAALGSALPLGTLYEYFFGASAVIDNMFVTSFVDAKVRFAGRMAPNTLVALLLTAAAIFFYARSKILEKRDEFILAILGSVIAALGIVPLVGYMGGIQAAHTWGSFAGMALHTSLCFILLGSAIVACIWKRAVAVPSWLPIPVAIGFLIIALSIWLAVKEYENIQFEQGLQREALYAAGRTGDRLTAYYAAIDRVGRRWTMAGGTPRALWEDDARGYLKSYTFLKSMQWIDSANIARWIVPAEGIDKQNYVWQNDNATQTETLLRARETMQGQITDPVDIQGTKSFFYITPVAVKGKYDGAIVATFTLDDVFNRLLARSSIGPYYLTASQAGVVFFTNMPSGYSAPERWQKTATLKNRDKTWTINVTPSPEMLADKNSPLPTLVLITGLLTTFFATFSILLAIYSRRAANILRRSEERIKQMVSTHSMLASADFNLHRFMNEAVASLGNLTPASGAVIEIVDGDDMVYEATAGSVKNYQGMRMKRLGSLSGRCVERREIVMSEDTSADPNVNAEACRKVGAASMVLAPLIQRGNVVGVLKILSSKAYEFSAQDVQTLELVAGLIGGALGQQMDIERREKLEDQLRHLAHNDSLTGLPNRMLFRDRLSQALINNARTGGIMAVMYMDIDRFKNINDVFGHAEGDALLREFAARIVGVLRKGDTLARLGGDEFTVIAENLKNPKDAEKIAAKIVNAARVAFNLPNVTLNVSVSVGIAVAHKDEDPDKLIARADQALYETKRAGRNGFTLSKDI